jgi:hypothetical protein
MRGWLLVSFLVFLVGGCGCCGLDAAITEDVMRFFADLFLCRLGPP